MRFHGLRQFRVVGSQVRVVNGEHGLVPDDHMLQTAQVLGGGGFPLLLGQRGLRGGRGKLGRGLGERSGRAGQCS
jgi:hypothetical protein